MEAKVQYDLFTGGLAYPPMTDQEKVDEILKQYPETRNSDGLLLYHFWMEFDGLGDVLRDQATRDRFRAFLQDKHTTPAESVRRRRQDRHQLESTGGGDLMPTPDVVEYRLKRAHGGPPRGRR